MESKMVVKGLILAVAGLAFTASSALAVQFSFSGSYNYDGTQISFDSLILPFGTDPVADPLVAGEVTIASLAVDNSGVFGGGGYFIQAFDVNNAGLGGDVFTADFDVAALEYSGLSTASINSNPVENLHNITAGAGYVPGSSAIADAFISIGHGYTILTFQSNNLWNLLAAGNPFSGTFSGTAYPGTPAQVPEPASMLLFGAGLVGLVGVTRRRIRLAGKQS